MGGCLSKKSVCASSTPISDTQLEKKKKTEEETIVKKQIFIIKHRKSHEIERPPRLENEKVGLVNKAEAEVFPNVMESGELGIENGVIGGGPVVRTSSCTKDELDAILIQCGRLRRSSSTGKAAESGGRKYSGSKRSYDFDNDTGKTVDDDAVEKERENRHRQSHGQSQGRRRTPSRERERDPTKAQQRSGSRERNSSGSRRVSRSPGRRSESPITTANCNEAGTNSNSCSRPGKMVSVPATVSSLAMDKSNNAGGEHNSAAAAVKRIQVKRNVGSGGDRAASPRARSPARIKASCNENGQLQPMSLSRSNSRKAEHSPYRRTPLSEIDTNTVMPQAQSQRPIASKTRTENKMNCSRIDKIQDQLQPTAEEKKIIMNGITDNVGLNIISSSESLKQPNYTRSRSSRLSRDFDIYQEALSSNPPAASSYTALLLEDIHNFHQKTTTTPPPPHGFSLSPCVTKACSILEAVADLNSNTRSNLPTTFTQTNPIDINELQLNNTDEKRQERKDPFLESEVRVQDDLTEPSFHKYVTVRSGSEELEEEESSGSNSFVGSQQQWLSLSTWEPNSVESTDRWTSSSSSCKLSSRQNVSGKGMDDENAKKQTTKNQQNGIGRGRIGSRGSHVTASASS